MKKPKSINHEIVAKHNKPKQQLELKEVAPITENQTKAFAAWDADYHLILRGAPGTGKTFLAFYFAFDQLLADPENFEEVVLIRSAVPSRDLGFMGGKRERDKLKEYERPYQLICSKLFGVDDAWTKLNNKGMCRFISTSFLRGNEFENAIVIIDEWQNMTSAELHTIVTRVGNNCRIILAGDEEQPDLNVRKNEIMCLDIIEILNSMTSVREIKFSIADIVRSGFVKDYLIARDQYLNKSGHRPLRKVPVMQTLEYRPNYETPRQE